VQPKLLRQSDRDLVQPIRHGWEEDQVSFALVMETGDPCSYNEAIEADESDKWVISMKQEIESLERNQRCDLVIYQMVLKR